MSHKQFGVNGVGLRVKRRLDVLHVQHLVDKTIKLAVTFPQNTARHLHQRIGEHRYSAIGKHLETQHGNNRRKIEHLFKVLRKCNSKFDCLVHEMLYIKDIKPSLNTQADSIRAKLFTWALIIIFLFVFLIPIGPANIRCIFFQILYTHFTLYTFSLFNLIMA